MRTSTYLFLSLIAFLLACNATEEEKTVVTLQFDHFSVVDLNSAFEVVLIQDSTSYIEIETTDDLQKKIEITLESETLAVTNTQALKWTNPANNIPKLYIHTSEFKQVNANESCNITSANTITGKEFGLVLTDKANYATLDLGCDVFFYWNNFPCGGKLTLSGRTKELKIWNTAIMSVDAKNLVTDFALVENDSKGICEVNVLNELEYQITGSGDIHLFGNPTDIREKIPSTNGKLIQF